MRAKNALEKLGWEAHERAFTQLASPKLPTPQAEQASAHSAIGTSLVLCRTSCQLGGR